MNIRTSSGEDRLKRIFTHNFREKVLSAFCALAVLLFALCMKPVSRTYNIKVNTKIAAGQVLVSQNAHLIEVKASGTFFDHRSIRADNLEANFDFSAEKAGETSVLLDKNTLPASFSALEIKSVSPQKLTVVTEERKAETAPEPAEAGAETSPEEKSVETPGSPEQKPAETSPEKPASGGKND